MAGLLLPAVAACVLLATAAADSAPSAVPHVFVVGGESRGWKQPVGNEETYNHWATRNRFHVDDFLEFKYAENDSVLVVTRDDYKLCSTAKPTLRFDGGETRFRIDRNGFFYFISGAPGHCDAGQRMTARVMAQRDEQDGAAPAEAPAMSPGDDDGGFDSGSGSSSGSGSGSTPWSGSSGSGSVQPPRGKAGGGNTSAACMHASFGGAVVGVVLGAVFVLS